MTHQIGSLLSFDGDARREEGLFFLLRLCKSYVEY